MLVRLLASIAVTCPPSQNMAANPTVHTRAVVSELELDGFLVESESVKMYGLQLQPRYKILNRY
jgi:hypothetical protein